MRPAAMRHDEFEYGLTGRPEFVAGLNVHEDGLAMIVTGMNPEHYLGKRLGKIDMELA